MYLADLASLISHSSYQALAGDDFGGFVERCCRDAAAGANADA
jgi:hypothetical protein